MNDIEDLVREEMRARAATAEAAAADEQPIAFLADLDRRIRRARLSRRWTTSALSAIAIAAAIALPLTLPSPGQPDAQPISSDQQPPFPLTDTAATPRGWAPVAYGDAQISVPASWYLEGLGTSVCGGGVKGMVFVGTVQSGSYFRRMGCGLTTNVASIGAIPPARAVSSPASTVNGIGVVPVPGPRGYLVFLVPTLHVRVMARGPLANRILGTLTRSPLSVVLASGRPFPVPPGWRWHAFGALRFAAPMGWSVERDKWWGGCPFGMAAETVRLSTATEFSDPSCPTQLPQVGSLQAQPGIVVGAGRFAVQNARQGQKVSCAHQHGMRICMLRPGESSAVLTLLVYSGRGGKSALVEIGLGDNGSTARTIFESIRPG
jgi:hypothetical protein